jgi:NAD(P)H-hydrate epimerase
MTLPDWLEPLPDPAEQRALDEWAIGELGMPGLDLMERAGICLAELVAELVPHGRIAVVCGKGNNGGDGLVAARVLREQGRDVDVLILGAAQEYGGDARANLERLPGSAPQPFRAAGLAGAAAIVDAILGTGFAGEPREPAAGAIAAINGAGVADRSVVVACDIPSGVDGSTGVVAGVAVRAHATATFHAAKPGLWIAPGKQHSGDVRVIDIGIPTGGPAEPRVGLIRPEVLDGVPRRGAESTKFAAGSVLVCGGSPGLTGAPCMAAGAAMRAGAGYVTACVPQSLHAIFEGRLLEVMTVPLRDTEGTLHPMAVREALERAARVDTVVLGPGLGRDPGAVRFARGLAMGSTPTPASSRRWPTARRPRFSRPTQASSGGCSGSTVGTFRRAGSNAPAVPLPRRGRWSSSKETTRSSLCPTVAPRSVAAVLPRSPPQEPETCSRE